MADNRIKSATASFLKKPLIYPFRTALGQHDTLENILFTLELGDGTKGFGEAAIATHITGETTSETMAHLQDVGDGLAGKDISDYAKLSKEFNERLPGNKSAVAAVEMSLMDALAQKRKIPLWRFFGDRCKKLRTDITLVIASLSETKSAAEGFYRQGFRRFKVKIGRDRDIDYQRVAAVQGLAPDVEIILDANQGYSADETLQFLGLLKKGRISPILIEQPTRKDDWEGLQKVTRSSKIPVCADESASSLEDVAGILQKKIATAVNIKLMKFGLIQAWGAAMLVKVFGAQLMMGGMMETSLSMTSAAHLAGGLGFFDYIDLDTPFFIKNGFDRNPYLSPDGVYDLKSVKSGIGIKP